MPPAAKPSTPGDTTDEACLYFIGSSVSIGQAVDAHLRLSGADASPAKGRTLTVGFTPTFLHEVACDQIHSWPRSLALVVRTRSTTVVPCSLILS